MAIDEFDLHEEDSDEEESDEDDFESDDDESEEESDEDDRAAKRPRPTTATKQPRFSQAAVFLDDAAEVQDDDDEDDDEDEEDDIPEDLNEAAEAAVAARNFHRSRAADLPRSLSRGDKFVNELAEKYKERDDDFDGEDAEWDEEALEGTQEEALSLTDQASRQPTPRDPPLWLVRCKPGKEKDVVFQLMRIFLKREKTAKPLHIISAIACDHLKVFPLLFFFFSFFLFLFKTILSHSIHHW